MTKKEMIDYIEKTGRVIDFDRNYLMKKLKKEIEWLYNVVKEQEENQKIGVDKRQPKWYNKYRKKEIRSTTL